MSEDYDEFHTAFWNAKRAMAEAAEAAFNRLGVRAGQQFILGCLWQQDGLTPGQIAKQLGLSTPTVTRAATRMESTGLLRRERHPSDARLVRLCLTERGHSLREDMARARVKLTARATAGMSTEDTERLISLLYTIRDNLK